MRTIVAGTRTTTAAQTFAAIDSCPWKDQITLVVSGKNRIEHDDGTITGADYWGEQWAIQHGIPVDPHPYPRQFGRQGGPIRNGQMAQSADAAIVVWDGKSRGSFDMLQKARARGLRIHEVVWAEVTP